MNSKILVLLSVLFLSAFAISCSNDDDKTNKNVPEAVTKAFEELNPNVNPKWEYEDSYYVADFTKNNNETEMWFTAEGKWMLTVTDLTQNQLPTAITSAIAASAYSNWTYDDEKLIERNGFDALYKIEMEEKGTGNEVTLYYAANGMLVKEIPDIDNNGTITPVVIPQKIQDYLDQNFPSSKYSIIDFDREDATGNYEVEVIGANTVIDITFTAQYAFLYYEYEIKFAEVPATIQQLFNKSGYTQNQIDDILYRSNATGLPWYIFDLEVNDNDLTLIWDQNGTVIK